MYWAENNAGILKDVLEKMAPGKGRMKRQVQRSVDSLLHFWITTGKILKIKSFQPPQDLLKDITNNIQKLVDDLRTSETPEAVAFLHLLGNEIGYMKTSEIRTVLETLTMYYQIFFNVLPYKVRLGWSTITYYQCNIWVSEDVVSKCLTIVILTDNLTAVFSVLCPADYNVIN